MQSACAILSSFGCSALQYFSTLSHKRHDFRKNVTEHKMCVLIFSKPFVWNISHSKKNWARYDHKCILVFMYRYPLFYSYMNETWIFSTEFRKMLKYQISWKFIQCEPSCSMRKGGRTDKTRLIVTFRNFANAPKTPYVLNLKRKVVEGTRQWRRGRCRKYNDKKGIPGAVASVTLGCKEKLRNKKQA
jgi:hypothetical protein